MMIRENIVFRKSGGYVYWILQYILLGIKKMILNSYKRNSENDGKYKSLGNTYKKVENPDPSDPIYRYIVLKKS